MTPPTHTLATIDTLSDAAAIERLFELTASGNDDPAELARLDALVYGRLLQAYERDEVPALQDLRAA